MPMASSDRIWTAAVVFAAVQAGNAHPGECSQGAIIVADLAGSPIRTIRSRKPFMSRGKNIGSPRKPSRAGALRELVLGPAGKYLLVGGLSFAVDFLLLLLLHEVFGVHLWLATPIAFLTSLAANYLLQRSFTFSGTSVKGTSFLKYMALVAFNTVAASFIVSGFEALGSSYMLGKVISTAAMTIWNFFAYKYWVFTAKTAAPDPAAGTA